MRVLIVLWVSLWGMVCTNTIASTNSHENAFKSRTIYSQRYIAEVKEFKKKILQSLEKSRVELQKKKYPQAYFIRSLQEQIKNKSFLDKTDFIQTEELLLALGSSVQSQYSANRNLSNIETMNSRESLEQINSLKENFQKENLLMPASIGSAPQSNTYQFLYSLPDVVLGFSFLDKVMLVAAMFLIAFLMFKKSTTSTKANKKLSKKTKIPFKFSINQLANIPDVSFCIVSNRNVVLKQNELFKKNFNLKNGEVFIYTNHLVPLSSYSHTEVLTLRNTNNKKKFLLNKTSTSPSGEVIYLINQFENDSLDSVKIENKKLNIVDLVEDAVIKFQSFNCKYEINFSENGNWSVALDGSNIQEQLINSYFKAIYCLTLHEDKIYPVNINITENRKKILINCRILGAEFSENDFKKPITSGRKVTNLNSIFMKMKNLHPGLLVKIKAKNSYNEINKEFCLDLVFNRQIEEGLLKERVQTLN